MKRLSASPPSCRFALMLRLDCTSTRFLAFNEWTDRETWWLNGFVFNERTDPKSFSQHGVRFEQPVQRANPEFFAKRLSQAFGQIGVPRVWVHGSLSITRRNWPPCRFRLRIEQPSPQAAPIQPLASRQSASPRHWLFQNREPQRKNEPLSSLLIKAKERPRGKSLLIKGTHKSCGIKGSQSTN